MGNFYQEITPTLQEGTTVFGVDYNYESDASGEFSIMAGSDNVTKSKHTRLEHVKIPIGKFLVFKETSDMPPVIKYTRSRIWD